MLASIITHDLILAGAGHSNLFIAHYFFKNPCQGLRITLINPDSEVFYSGMLSGAIVGNYSLEDCQIDLRQFCQSIHCRFLQARITHIDTEEKILMCAGYPEVHYDILAINIATASPLPSENIPFSASVKPLANFYRVWQDTIKRIQQTTERRFKLAIVGGGLGSIEMTLALLHSVERKGLAGQLECWLFTEQPSLVPHFSKRVQSILTQELLKKQVHICTQHKMVVDGSGQILDHQGGTWQFDQTFWAYSGKPEAWLAQTGLALTPSGYIWVDNYLRSIAQPSVFALGDIAEMVHYNLPKSGVYAVRMGQHTAKNIENLLLKKYLLPYKPQKRSLLIIPIDQKKALAMYGKGVLGTGAWAWHWKRDLDRRYLTKLKPWLQSVPMAIKRPRVLPNEPHEEWLELQKPLCGGCSAKVSAEVLFRTLQPDTQLQGETSFSTIIPDDAAVISLPPGHYLIQSVDYLPILFDDPYIFGQIATIHALNDLYAMGATPHSAQSIISLPRGFGDKQHHELKHLLLGIQKSLNQANCRLLGGHTSLSEAVAVGLVVNGLLPIDKQNIWWKNQLQLGDILILTKPLGSGLLLAANMRGFCKGYWLTQLINTLLISHQPAVAIGQELGIHAATDVSGFGLAGHLLEMSQNFSIRLDLAELRLYEGVEFCLQQGLLSSLHTANRTYALPHLAGVLSDAKLPILFDPQTAGGLVMSVPRSQADACLHRLKTSVYPQAHIIGEVIALQNTKVVVA
ncbi:MAG: selenide, water dikinase SelD [Gammaproteobacteria bacterium]|nr:selenide, water dikinase SelD [Gammaproteobacteria bacterium]